VLTGLPGSTRLLSLTSAPAATGEQAQDISISGVSFDGQGKGPGDGKTGLVAFSDCSGLSLSDCRFANIAGNCLQLNMVSGRVVNCDLSSAALTGLMAVDSQGLLISDNRVSHCGNGGIRVFRQAAGHDGTVVTGNRVTGIKSGSGNGQNGNGINAYLADDIVISNNVVSDCDFSAIRVNSTRNAIISGNNCTDCREVAIFSEFGFSGSVIASNVVDGAALGISIANLDNDGHLAVCAGNVVRNILAASPTNPDTMPVGIFAEADTAISGNVIENVPGVGIGAGWGPYLRNVAITGNVIRDIDLGIVVSVAPEAGKARVADNMISGARDKAIAAYRWTEAAGDDLANHPDRFKTISIAGNVISP